MDNQVCAECDAVITDEDIWVIYDGEKCHMHCAAEAEGEAGFDLWFMDR